MRIFLWVQDDWAPCPVRAHHHTHLHDAAAPRQLGTHEVNPATGLPMVDGMSVDMAGNPYGTDMAHSSQEPRHWEDSHMGCRMSDSDFSLCDSTYFSSGFHGDW